MRLALFCSHTHPRVKDRQGVKVRHCPTWSVRASSKISAILHLFEEKIGDVGARDRAASPDLRVAKHLVAAGLRSARQDDGPNNDPIETAAFHDNLLGILVVVGATEQKLEEHGLKRTELCAAVVSNPSRPLGEDLERHQAMKRFHVRTEDGRLVSGAAAFVEVWKQLPQWRWAARAAATPGMVALLETTYQLFLAARPHLARLFTTLSQSARREEIRSDS